MGNSHETWLKTHHTLDAVNVEHRYETHKQASKRAAMCICTGFFHTHIVLQNLHVFKITCEKPKLLSHCQLVSSWLAYNAILSTTLGIAVSV